MPSDRPTWHYFVWLPRCLENSCTWKWWNYPDSTRFTYMGTAEGTIQASLYAATRQFLTVSGPSKRLIFPINNVLLLLHVADVPTLTFPVPVTHTQMHGTRPAGLGYSHVTWYRLIPYNDHACLDMYITDRRREKRTVLFWVITQRVMVIPYRRFGTTYRSHLQVHGARCDFRPQLCWLADTSVLFRTELITGRHI